MSDIPPSQEQDNVPPVWLSITLVTSLFVLAVVFAFGFAFSKGESNESSFNSYSIFTKTLPKS